MGTPPPTARRQAQVPLLSPIMGACLGSKQDTARQPEAGTRSSSKFSLGQSIPPSLPESRKHRALKSAWMFICKIMAEFI